ncbi:hypothetical protein IKF94_02095, partial [Candidatus Saccharibacteria bacterium]|nr:hypothetical protein [Candidatus Saccharibacteria bacterium]
TLIGILFFFVLLGARQAGIIMLVVVSPVAFAAYMLPNTKTFFDKWLKAFEGLLLLFPICGIIMGGSAFASKILMTVDLGFLGNLVAMLVGVVPFFFIPGLLRSAFAAMGNIGARISGAGQRLGRGLAGMAGRSDALKETQTRMAAGIKRNGDLSWSGKRRAATARGETLMGKVPGVRRRASLSQARSWAAYEKMQDELDLASRPELIRSEAETRRFGRRQAAEDAILVNSGVANRTGDVKDFKSASQFEEGTLAFAAMQAAHSGNDAAQYAITERMLASGHHGAEAYRQVLQALEQEGNTKALSNFARAGKNSRHTADLKSGARSTFDYINAVTDGKVIDGNSIRPGHQLQDYVEKTKFANMSEAQLFNTDNEELSRYFSYVKDKRASIAAATEQKQQELGRELTAEERDDVYKQQFASEGERQQYEALVSQATNAYNNVRLRGNAKESRQNLVADIAGIPEDKRVTSGSNQINIDHSKNQGNAGGGNADTGTDGAGNNTGGSTGTNNSTPAVTEETLQQMAQQYNNQSGYSNRGNVSDEDIQRNINRLRSKANPSLQEMEMLNRLYNEQGTRQNLRQANQNANNSGSSSPRPNPSPNRGAGTPV